jgi:hypothetical protein
VDNIDSPNVFATLDYLLENSFDLDLGDSFTEFQKLAQVTTIAEVQYHIQVITGLDWLVELDAVGCFDSWVDFDFFFDTWHLLGRNVYDFHCFARVDFGIGFFHLRNVARFANTSVLALAQELVQENNVVVDQACVGFLVIEGGWLVRWHTAQLFNFHGY